MSIIDQVLSGKYIGDYCTHCSKMKKCPAAHNIGGACWSFEEVKQ